MKKIILCIFSCAILIFAATTQKSAATALNDQTGTVLCDKSQTCTNCHFDAATVPLPEVSTFTSNTTSIGSIVGKNNSSNERDRAAVLFDTGQNSSGSLETANIPAVNINEVGGGSTSNYKVVTGRFT